MTSFHKLNKFLSKQEKKSLLLLLVPLLITSLVSVAGVASVIPFITIAAKPGLVYESSKLMMIYNFFGFKSVRSFIMLLGLVAFVMLLITNFSAAFSNWSSTRVVSRIRANIAHRVYSIYLNFPYEFYLNNNSATLTSNIITLTSQFTNGFLLSGLQVVSNAIIIFCLIVLIIIASPMVALLTMLLFSGAYFTIYKALHPLMAKKGILFVQCTEKIYKIVLESFGGIKDVKLKNNEHLFIEQSYPILQKEADCNSITQLMTTMPKYALEVFAFGGVILITILILYFRGGHLGIIPILGLYAYSGYRILPALQVLFAGVSSMKVSVASLNKIYDSVFNNCYFQKDAPHKNGGKFTPLEFKNEIVVSNLRYRYPHSAKDVLKNVDLVVKYNETIGIIGASGVGKTTLVDILLGLLEASAGTISVDGHHIRNKADLKGWQSLLSYVPQFIYLTDSTVRENITFGARDVNKETVEAVAEVACIHDFIVSELPDGYDTIVGERGVRLSGGQIQRIGIARALYSKPKVLILDEATSSLDVQTELQVMEAVKKLKHKMTIIIIAHRLSTVDDCDRVYLINDGHVQDHGTLEALINRHNYLHV